MKLVFAILSSVGFVVSFFVWMMLIFTGACFDDAGFSSTAIITFFSFAGFGITSFGLWCWIIVEAICKACRKKSE